MKINTPLRLTIFCSLAISFVAVILLLVYNIYFVEISLSILIYSFFFLLLFLLSVAIIFIFLEVFINRKIRLLFRMVQNYKTTSSNFRFNMSEDFLSASEAEILKLAKKNSSELVKLKFEEKFRREFMGNLAHELKTPIFSIQGYILTLLEGGLEDPSINKRFLNRALKGVERMNKIILDLDMITRFESERINMQFNENNIVEICQEIIDGLELKAKAKNISLKFSKSYASPIMVNCDRLRIGQVIQNLIINAVNYSDPDSEVILRFIDVDPNILIEVEDNGPGINEKDTARLFERFYRVDKSRARNEGGTGLGLSIVKHIIEGHGHNIGLRSKEGEGSTFFFTLTKV